MSNKTMDNTMDDATTAALRARRPVCWENPACDEDGGCGVLSRADLDASVRMWAWLRPLFVLLFPEEVTNPPWGEPGTVSSPLRRIDAMGRALGLRPGRCLLKADSNLAVCGSVKARGGMFEVFNVAAHLAKAFFGGLEVRESELQSVFDPRGAGFSSAALAEDPKLRAHLAEREIVVGSTGNLGLSVGLGAAALGMRAVVHMSTDAKAWTES